MLTELAGGYRFLLINKLNISRIMYDYDETLSNHISDCFPGMELLEAFTIFDPSTIPQDFGQQASDGHKNLKYS